MEKFYTLIKSMRGIYKTIFMAGAIFTPVVPITPPIHTMVMPIMHLISMMVVRISGVICTTGLCDATWS